MMNFHLRIIAQFFSIETKKKSFFSPQKLRKKGQLRFVLSHELKKRRSSPKKDFLYQSLLYVRENFAIEEDGWRTATS